jgi:hypothetical protein
MSKLRISICLVLGLGYPGGLSFAERTSESTAPVPAMELAEASIDEIVCLELSLNCNETSNAALTEAVRMRFAKADNADALFRELGSILPNPRKNVIFITQYLKRDRILLTIGIKSGPFSMVREFDFRFSAAGLESVSISRVFIGDRPE